MGSQLIPIISTSAGNEIPSLLASDGPWLAPAKWQHSPTRAGDGVCWENLLDAPTLTFGLEHGWQQVLWGVPERGDKWEAAS